MIYNKCNFLDFPDLAETLILASYVGYNGYVEKGMRKDIQSQNKCRLILHTVGLPTGNQRHLKILSFVT